MDKFTQIDLFGLSVFVENKHGQQLLYTIEQVNGLNYCFVQKRSSQRCRWGLRRLIESSKTTLRFEYEENETGFKLQKTSVKLF